jgi:hypothetical protein
MATRFLNTAVSRAPFGDSFELVEFTEHTADLPPGFDRR